MNPQYYGAAAEYNKPKGVKSFLSGKVVIIVGIAVVVIIVLIAVITLIGGVASGPRNELARLSARVQRLHDLLEDNVSNTKDPDLKKVSAEAKLYLSTNLLALNEAYGGKLPENIVNDEADSAALNRLGVATQAGRHDAELLAIIKEKSASILELSEKIQMEATGPKTRSAATQTTEYIDAINRQLANVDL